MQQKPGNNFTDKELVSKTLKGDQEAFKIIVKQTERLVAQIIFKMVTDYAERKDLAQDVFLKAYTRLSGFRFESKLSTWIARIAYHTCLDHLKRKRVVVSQQIFPDSNDEETYGAGPPEMISDHEDPVRRKELASIMEKEIRKLPIIYQTLIVLYHKEECSYEEIEAITSLPMGTVKNYLFRARKLLRNNLLEQYKKEEL